LQSKEGISAMNHQSVLFYLLSATFAADASPVSLLPSSGARKAEVVNTQLGLSSPTTLLDTEALQAVEEARRSIGRELGQT
jgi:hypothetical protein